MCNTQSPLQETLRRNKSLMEKMALVEQLDKKEKTAFYAVLDAFLGKKKMKDALSNVLTNV